MNKWKALLGICGTFFSLQLWGFTTETATMMESPLNFGLDIHYSAVDYRNYAFTDADTNSQLGHAVHVAFEWLPVKSLGKLGIGFATAGVFGLSNVPLSGNRYASLNVLPLEGFLSYRAEYVHQQVLVPYVKAGASVLWVRQTSETGAEVPGTRAYYGRDLSLGLEICLSKIDPEASRKLDRSVGINSTYLVVEYTQSRSIGPAGSPNLSHDAYRAGLRFEL
ncbi:MAG: hypothetical protein KDD51_02005 [Bdellovibrionales bacterium]|nr:hypothetical protein [Bdellovibrionales bacterium]